MSYAHIQSFFLLINLRRSNVIQILSIFNKTIFFFNNKRFRQIFVVIDRLQKKFCLFFRSSGRIEQQICEFFRICSERSKQFAFFVSRYPLTSPYFSSRRNHDELDCQARLPIVSLTISIVSVASQNAE